MNYTSTVNLSSGQILFGDPTQPWNRRSNGLPPTSLALTARGTISNQNISQLTFTNRISYESFESSNQYSSLQKTLIVGPTGEISYQTPKLSYTSTINTLFSTSIRGFTPNTIGGPNILDATSSNPDTITNAIAKIDNWIQYAFLKQPPAITQVQQISTSLFAGVRWSNFPSLNILNGTIPQVTSILIVVGNPDGDNLALEILDPTYFPLQYFTDGISPVLNPLVQMRIFTDFFPQDANVSYTKALIDSTCLRIINNTGSCELPNSGLVLSFDKTNNIDTYTTLNIYLPKLNTEYPKNTPIPLRVVYMNKTLGDYNIAFLSTTITTFGGPSVPFFSTNRISPSSIQYNITSPSKSDSTHNRSESFFSTYKIQYKWDSWRTVFDNTSGFVYGASNRTTLPDIYSIYSSTFIYDIPFQSTLSTVLIGILPTPFLPGANWSTTIAATNLGKVLGDFANFQSTSTQFPSTIFSTLNDTSIVAIVPFISRSTYTLQYNGSWNINSYVSNDVVFLSTPTTIGFSTLKTSQFNDSSYPGDRNPILLTLQTLNTSTTQLLQVDPFKNDYNLNSNYTSNNISVHLLDTLSTKLFYQINLTAQPILSTQSTLQANNIQFFLNNTGLFSGIQSTQIFSTQNYQLGLELVQPFQYSGTVSLSTVTSTTYISGLLTPALNSSHLYTGFQSNQFFNIVLSSFGNTFCKKGEETVESSIATYVSSFVFLDAGTPIITLPFPANRLIQMSSLRTPVGITYNDPRAPDIYTIYSLLTCPYPLVSPIERTIELGYQVYIDTVSQIQPISSIRLINRIPRQELILNENDIGDGVNASGLTSNGLQVNFSPFISLQSSFSTILQSTILYDNTTSLATGFPSYYSRELMRMNGVWINPAQINFSIFKGNYLGCNSYIYPDFTYNLVCDSNYGMRYGTFLNQYTLSTPTVYRSVNITIVNPNIVSTISHNQNYPCFPDSPVDCGFLMSTLSKLHIKLIASYEQTGYKTIETEWINGFKLKDNYFNDSIYDIGGCLRVISTISSVSYNIAITPRYYTNISLLTRIGLPAQRYQVTGDWLTFQDFSASFQ